MWKVLIITIAIVAVALLLLCVRILLKPNGRFSSQHISQSEALRERGIGCANQDDRNARRGSAQRIDPKEL